MSRSRNTSVGLGKKFRSDENLTSRTGTSPTSCATSVAQNRKCATPTSQETKLKTASERSRATSRSVDRPGSAIIRSRSVETPKTTSPLPVRSNIRVSPSVKCGQVSTVPAASNAEKQVVVMSRTGRRHTLTTAEPMTSSKNGLKKKFNSGKLGFTVEKLLPNYQQRKENIQKSSISVDESAPKSLAKNPRCGSEVRCSSFKRSSSLQELPSVTPLLEDFPDAPSPEEDLNARMELLFEEYRKVELGLIFKKSDAGDIKPQEHPEEKGRTGGKMASVGISTRRQQDIKPSIQTPARSRARSVSQDRSVVKVGDRTPRRESLASTSTARTSRIGQGQAAPCVVTNINRANRTRSVDRAVKVSHTDRLSSVQQFDRREQALNHKMSAPVQGNQRKESTGHPKFNSQPRNQLQNDAKHSSTGQIGKSTPDSVSDISAPQTVRRNSAQCLLHSKLTKESSKSESHNTPTQDSSQRNAEEVASRTLPEISTENPNQKDINGLGTEVETFASTNSADRPGTSLRKDNRYGFVSRIPVPIHLVKSYSSSRLNRCDSGVDIANNFVSNPDN